MEENKKTIVTQITLKAEIDAEFYSELKGIIEHHIDYIMDLGEFPEIKGIFDAKLSR